MLRLPACAAVMYDQTLGNPFCEFAPMIAGSLDLIISTISVPPDIPRLLGTLAPKGILHVVEAVLEPMPIPAFGLIMGQSRFSVRPPAVRQPSTEFSPSVPGIPLLQLPKLSPCRESTMHSTIFAPARPATASCSSMISLEYLLSR